MLASVLPSQLHQNSWVFIRVFEIVTHLLNQLCSSDLFFTIFEMVFQVEKESMKLFEGDFSYVVPTNDATMAEVVSSDVAGKIEAAQFHLDWSYDHFLVKTNTYSEKEAQLS